MKRTVAALAAGVVLFSVEGVIAATHAESIIGWRVVKSHSASGQFAVTSISADIKRPKLREHRRPLPRQGLKRQRGRLMLKGLRYRELVAQL